MNEADPQADRVVRTVIVMVYALLVVRDAWVGDDPYITLRTVDHLVHGRGLVWNLGERVQAYTHPLWMFVLAGIHAFTREGWLTLLVPSIVCSVAAVVVFARSVAPKGPAGWAVLALLPLSRAFVDYSTSGLENPLTHLLLAGALVVWFRHEAGLRSLTALALLLGLAMTNRMDSVLLLGPLVAAAAWEASRVARGGAIALRVAAGLLPFVVWEVFSLVYYGALVPNPALAKLGTGIPRGELAEQGLYYLLDSLERDPLTLLVVACGLLAARRDRRAAVVAFGAALYVLYVVRIGGDFMTGRFLAAPFFAAVACLARLPLPAPAPALVAAVSLLVSFSADLPTLAPVTGPLPEQLYQANARGIADERSYFALRGTGLASASRTRSMPDYPWRESGERLAMTKVRLIDTAGMRGWAAPPAVYLLDTLALTDPLLARLPARYDPDWRVGHYRRALPDGYWETLGHDQDRFADRDLAALFEAVRTVVRGPIFSSERWRAIWGLHTGAFAVDRDRYRYFGAVPVVAGAPANPSDTALDRADAIDMPNTGVRTALDAPSTQGRLVVRRRANVDMHVLFYREGALVAECDLPRALPSGDWLAGDEVEVPRRAVKRGYDAIRLVPVAGPEPWMFLSVELADHVP